MMLNVKSSLFASLMLLVGLGIAAPISDTPGDSNVMRRQTTDAWGNIIAYNTPPLPSYASDEAKAAAEAYAVEQGKKLQAEETE